MNPAFWSAMNGVRSNCTSTPSSVILLTYYRRSIVSANSVNTYSFYSSRAREHPSSHSLTNPRQVS